MPVAYLCRLRSISRSDRARIRRCNVATEHALLWARFEVVERK